MLQDLWRTTLDMVYCWKAGWLMKVIEGCCNGVFAIKALDEYASEHGELFYFPRESQQRERIAVA